MVLGLLKWLKETRFYKKRKKNKDMNFAFHAGSWKKEEACTMFWEMKVIFQSSKKKKEKKTIGYCP